MNTPSDLNVALSYHGPLGRWYAEPIDAEAARQQLDEWIKKRQQRLRQGRGDAIILRLACAMIRFQSGENVDTEITALERLFQQRRSPRALALLYLIQGQLRAARHLPGAKDKLAQGFRLANRLLHPQDYFSLLHRHRLLALLPVSSGADAQPLKSLLQTAAIQEQLETTHKPKQTPQPNTFF